MRIGFDAKRAFNNPRGLGNYSREFIRILCSHSPENHYYLFTPGVDPSIDFRCPSNAVLQQPSHAAGKVKQATWRTFGIAKEAEKLGLDIYHGLSHELPSGIEKTTKTVLTMHDLTFIKHPEWFPVLDRMMYRKKYLSSCQRADRIIAISELTKRDLLELTEVDPNKVEVVYQGCNPAFREMKTEAEKQRLRERYGLPESYLLNVAAIEPRKNQRLILEAMAVGDIDIPLVIAGTSTAYLEELQQVAAENRLQKRVIWLPDLPLGELPTLYQAATLFIFPSLYEGFGIPVVEALESGLPVIAAKGSCLEESGGPDSVFIDPNDAEELAERIKTLLDDESRRGRMALRGKAYVQRFSDAAINEKVIRIYKMLQP